MPRCCGRLPRSWSKGAVLGEGSGKVRQYTQWLDQGLGPRQAAVRAEKPNHPLEPVPSPVTTEVVDHLTVPGGRQEAVSEQRACWLLGLTPQAGRVCAFARAHALLSVWPQTRRLKKVPRAGASGGRGQPWTPGASSQEVARLWASWSDTPLND